MGQNSPPQQSREALALALIPLVKHLALQVAAGLPRTVEFDDLLHDGVLGLLDAIDKFDPSRGVKFETYAYLRVRSAILRSLRKYDLFPPSPAEMADARFEALKAELREQLAGAVDRLARNEQLILALYFEEELTMGEIAEVLGCSKSTVSRGYTRAIGKLRLSLGIRRVVVA